MADSSEPAPKLPVLPDGDPPGFHLLAKPSGSTCNIDCTYCFFLSKEALYPNQKSRMSPATLEAYIRQLLESHRTPEVTVAWQGGEPTLMRLDFFQRAVELVEQYRCPGQNVHHTFQTNGILLDDDWCAFFKKHDFLVGLSVDGPRELHDTYRVDRRGQGTFDQVMKGWQALRRHGVDFNILCTVNAANEKLVNCVIRNCVMENNEGPGMLVYLRPLSAQSDPVSIRFENCLVRGGGSDGMVVGAVKDDGPGGSIEFVNCVTENTARAAVRVSDKSAGRARVGFTNCSWSGAWRGDKDRTAELHAPIELVPRRPEVANQLGGVDFADCDLFDAVNRPAVAVIESKTESGVTDLTGRITLHGPHEARTQLGPDAGNISLVVVKNE